jgi:hypothetical protein
MLQYSPQVLKLWQLEKQAVSEALLIEKGEPMIFLRNEDLRIRHLSRQEAITELIKSRRTQEKIDYVNRLNVNRILDLTT